jgi:subtilisin family serine protease
VANWNNPAPLPSGSPYQPRDPFRPPVAASGSVGLVGPSDRDATPGCGTYLGFVLLSLWIIIPTLAAPTLDWIRSQAQELNGLPISAPGNVIGDIAGLLALRGLPLALFAFVTVPPLYRAIYQTWGLATGCAAILSLVRLLPPTWDQRAMLLESGLSLAAAAGLILVLVRRGPRLPWRGQGGSTLAALALLPILAGPWLIIGALGSVPETLLTALVGASVGLLAGVLLSGFLLVPLATQSGGPGWDVLLGGWAAGVALLVLGGSVGVNGTALLVMLPLAALGWLIAALSRLAARQEGGPWQPLALGSWIAGIALLVLSSGGGGGILVPLLIGVAGIGAAIWLMMRPPPITSAGGAWLPVAVLTGGVVAAPLLLEDPEELSLLLGVIETPFWALLAVVLAVLIGWGLGLILGLGVYLFREQWTRPPRLRVIAPLLGLTCIGGLLAYGLGGHPGFYGDKLFVILRNQADLSEAAAIPDYPARRRAVYQVLTTYGQQTQARLRADLARLGITSRPFYLVNAFEVDDSVLVRDYLVRQPEVSRVLASPHLRPVPAPDLPLQGEPEPPATPPWNITAVGADKVWSELGVRGKGIIIGQADSGVDGQHPALRARYRGRDGQDAYNWLDPWNGTRQPTDTIGHGTHTLGTILGQGGIGVAPDAEWIGCVNLARNLGNPSYYLDCMQFLFAPYPPGSDPLTAGDPARGADILSNSWGCPPIEGCDATALRPAVDALHAAGLFFVASAGNDGPECGTMRDPPATYNSAFTVGASDADNQIASFSSRGPVAGGKERVGPDLLAPGVDVVSALPGNAYGPESGTSMAGPEVAGTVALMWSAQPRLIGDPDRTRQILKDTAHPYQGEVQTCYGNVRSSVVGHGILDAYAAVKAALSGAPASTP